MLQNDLQSIAHVGEVAERALDDLGQLPKLCDS